MKYEGTHIILLHQVSIHNGIGSEWRECFKKPYRRHRYLLKNQAIIMIVIHISQPATYVCNTNGDRDT